MAEQKIIVPNIGDFKEVEVIEILVKEGQKIKKDESVITLESDKSSVEVPSPVAGKIIELNIKIGDKVSKGSLLAKLESDSANTEIKKEAQEEFSVTEKEILETTN